MDGVGPHRPVSRWAYRTVTDQLRDSFGQSSLSNVPSGHQVLFWSAALSSVALDFGPIELFLVPDSLDLITDFLAYSIADVRVLLLACA